MKKVLGEPRCRVCGEICEKFLDLGQQPVANRFITEDEIANEEFYNLNVRFCPNCKTVQLGKCPDVSQVFDKDYKFFTGTSLYMTKHLQALAGDIKDRYLGPHGKILEIGCNDGTLLEKFKDYNHIGYDPAEQVVGIAKSKGLNVVAERFNQRTKLPFGQVDVIVTCNTFAHVPDRHGMVYGLKTNLAPDGVWIDEEPYLGKVIDQLAYDQFYNEHVFYSTVVSMSELLRTYDLEIKNIEFTWPQGGSVRYYVGHKTGNKNEKVDKILANENLDTIGVFRKFASYVEAYAQWFVDKIKQTTVSWVGYAAAAKSTTVLNYCQLGPNDIKCIYDNTPDKQGRLSPGMHVPVVSSDRFRIDRPQHVVLFAWNHMREIMLKESEVYASWLLPIAFGGHRNV